MLIRPVIATNITNLTDARYFASWGVDYLLYNLNQISLVEVIAIAEWVDGVKTLLQLDAENIHNIDEVLLRLKPYAIGTSDTFSLEKILTYISEGDVFYDFGKQVNNKIIISPLEHIDPTSSEIAQLGDVLTFSVVETAHELSGFLLKDKSGGIIISGSIEEEVGLKSYENMDEILELLVHEE